MSANWEAILKGDLDALHLTVYERTADQRDDPSSREQEYADAILALCQRCKAAESEARRAVEERDRIEAAARAQSFSGHDWNRLLNERDAASALADRLAGALRGVIAAGEGRSGGRWDVGRTALRAYDEAKKGGGR